MNWRRADLSLRHAPQDIIANQTVICDKLVIQEIFTYLAIAAAFAIFAVMLLANVLNYRRDRADQRNKKEFEQFEASLLNPEAGSRFFSGETKLLSETTIFLPECDESESFVADVVAALDGQLRREALGFLIRCYPYDGGTGIDLQLVDFVQGLEVLRNTLIAHQAPQSTFIEYETGELYIYE